MARFAVVSALVLTSGGCAQLFGIDETTAGSGSQQDDVTLDIENVSVGTTVKTGPQALTINTATFYSVDANDPTTLDETLASLSGSEWSAPIAGTPSVVFTLPDFPATLEHVIALPSRALDFPLVQFQHQNATAAAGTEMVTLQATLPTPFASTESLEFYAVGAWTEYPLPAASDPALGTTAVNTTFAYSAATPFRGPLNTFTTDDRLLLLRYNNGNLLTGVGSVPAMDQGATSTLVFGSLAALAPTTTIAVPLDASMVTPRFAAAMPATPFTGLGWSVAASVTQDGIDAGPLLQSGGAAVTDTSVPLSFANPFATTDSWQATMLMVADGARTFTPADPALPVTLSAQFAQKAEPTAALTLDFPAAMPTMITLAGVPLTTDGIAIALDSTHAVTVDVTTDTSDVVLYQVYLYALVPNAAMTALDYQEVFDATSDQPSFTFPPELFPDGLYTISVVCYDGGYPGAETGDLTTQSFPFAYGALDSGVFTVSH